MNSPLAKVAVKKEPGGSQTRHAQQPGLKSRTEALHRQPARSCVEGGPNASNTHIRLHAPMLCSMFAIQGAPSGSLAPGIPS